MKELSRVEKAELYDEAVNYANYLINERCKEGTDGSFNRADLQKMFPGLFESEDEQHRKWILEYLYDGLRKADEQFKGQFKAAIVWLKKKCDKDDDIEYTRTDAFIEKAKKWFEIQNEGVDTNGNYKCDMTDFEDFIKFISE